MNIEDKGKLAEDMFKKWLDKHHLAYWYIKQDLATFSSALKEILGAKRPDFLILIPNIGLVLVDVKYSNPKFGNFAFNLQDIKKYVHIEETCCLKVWLVISNEYSDFKIWSWIPASKVNSIGKLGMKKSMFYLVPVKECTPISWEEGINKLFKEKNY